jgi:glycerophosphoryl diester phosphodiesterase
MFVIGHRGAAGLAQENTLEALRAGMSAHADMLEFDIRLTNDNIPVLAHDPVVRGQWIGRHTLDELKQSINITTLQEVLDEFFGIVLLNIELKQTRSVPFVLNMIERYITQPDDWDNILFSSFKPRALLRLRQLEPACSLAMLHHINPFTFMRYHKRLKFSAVGFHRLHVNSLALAVAKELKIFTYAYTVDRRQAAQRLQQRGLDAIVTNYPDIII